MTIETTFGGVAFLLGRLLFGGVLAFMGLGHFQQIEGMAGYAEAKGVPFPKASVLASGALLVAAGLAVVVGAFPVLAAAALALFLFASAVLFHDFWTVDDPETRQQEMTDFLKNAALAGGALLLIAVGGAEWPLAVGLSLG